MLQHFKVHRFFNNKTACFSVIILFIEQTMMLEQIIVVKIPIYKINLYLRHCLKIRRQPLISLEKKITLITTLK